MKEPSVRGQVAIVTGAGQGIGRSIALRLAQDGMHVTVADIRGDQAEKVADEIRDLGQRALPLKIDVTKADERELLFEATLAEFKRFDALVNNAAIQRIAHPLDVTEEHWDMMMNVNAKSVYFSCQMAVRFLLSQKSGRIVNIASIAGKMASTVHHPVYNVSKAAVIAITKTFAATYATQGIRVNAICPGVIDTPMQEMIDLEISRVTGQSPAEVREERSKRVPMGRLGDSEDVASVISFLVGPDSSYMTGQSINVSGGMITY